MASVTKRVVLFRKGRVLFELRIAEADRYPNGLTAAGANAILVPAAQPILQRFGNQQ